MRWKITFGSLWDWAVRLWPVVAVLSGSTGAVWAFLKGLSGPEIVVIFLAGCFLSAGTFWFLLQIIDWHWRRSTPLILRFSPDEYRFVRKERREGHGRGLSYWIAVKNSGDKTLNNVRVHGCDTDTGEGSTCPPQQVLNPGQEEFVQLFFIPVDVDDEFPERHFLVYATAQDTAQSGAVRLTLVPNNLDPEEGGPYDALAVSIRE